MFKRESKLQIFALPHINSDCFAAPPTPTERSCEMLIRHFITVSLFFSVSAHQVDFNFLLNRLVANCFYSIPKPCKIVTVPQSNHFYVLKRSVLFLNVVVCRRSNDCGAMCDNKRYNIALARIVLQFFFYSKSCPIKVVCN